MNGPMVNFLFYCHMFCLLSYICCFYYIILSESTERTGLHMRNLAKILPLKLRLFGKFQCCSAIDRSIKMVTNSLISKNLN